VDHLIGRKLSQNYRFVEGAKYQRKALQFAANYGPAQTQLCQDYCDLGEEEEGWTLADGVFAADKYNVAAYNLVTLHDVLAKYQTLKDDHFEIHMES